MKHLIALFIIGGLLCGPAVIWASDIYVVQWGVEEIIPCENTGRGNTQLSVACVKPATLRVFNTKEDAIKAIIGNTPTKVWRVNLSSWAENLSVMVGEMLVIETKDLKEKEGK